MSDSFINELFDSNQPFYRNCKKMIRYLVRLCINDLDQAKMAAFIHYIKSDKTEQQKRKDIITSEKVTSKILDKYDEYSDEFWKNPEARLRDVCGFTGTILIQAFWRFDRGLRNLPELKDKETRYRYIIENMLYYIDINERNASIFRRSIDPNDKYKVNCRVMNALELAEENETMSYNSAGNPPFIKGLAAKGTHFRKLYDLQDGHEIFLMIAIDKMAEGNISVLLLPSSLVHTQRCKHIREYVLKHCQVLDIEHLDSKAFPEITKPTMILTLKKSKSGNCKPTTFVRTFFDEEFKTSATLPKKGEEIWPMYFNDESVEFWKIMEKAVRTHGSLEGQEGRIEDRKLDWKKTPAPGFSTPMIESIGVPDKKGKIKCTNSNCSGPKHGLNMVWSKHKPRNPHKQKIIIPQSCGDQKGNSSVHVTRYHYETGKLSASAKLIEVPLSIDDNKMAHAIGETIISHAANLVFTMSKSDGKLNPTTHISLLPKLKELKDSQTIEKDFLCLPDNIIDAMMKILRLDPEYDRKRALKKKKKKK